SPLGLHEYNRLPQGLCNSPATFMRMMLTIFGDQNFLSLLCYLDDLLVFAKTEEESLARLEMVFRRLKEHNLKLSPSKCQFLKRSVKFLGHVISQDGISRDKVEAIVKVTEADLMELDGVTPSPSKIRSFLGMVIYYQHFIENCSVLAKPLFALTGGQKRPRKSKSNKRPLLTRKLGPDDWTQECSQAFRDLKAALTEEVLLAHPDFSKQFILSVDASTAGLGAVLSQIHLNSDKARPIAFASKSLNHAQAKYPAHRLEFFAMKWAICNKFSHWLRGHRFTVWTDNNPLKYILTKPRLDACEQRWVAQLAPFDFDIQYIPGTKNVVADALSRKPFVQSKILHRLTRAPYSTLLKQAANFQQDDVQNMFRLSAALPELRDVNAQFETQDATCEAVCIAGSVRVSSDEISAVMQTHQHWKDADRGRRPSRREKVHESRGTLRILRQWGKLNTRLGIVYRVSKHPVTKQKTYQYVVPESLRMAVLKGIHDDAGHQGQQRSLGLARQRFYWDTMEKDVKDYVHNCKRCIVSKAPEPEARAPLVSIATSSPLELVCIDFWSAEDHNNKTIDVLVVTDHFTKLACAYPCPNQSTKTVARVLWNNFFCVYGFPVTIDSDQGANFESLLIAELCQLAGIDKTHTTPYHPMGNGQVERMNRTLGNMIRALPPRSKVRWPQMLNTLTFAYNCTVHETTGFSPFFLMYGRTPRLPVDLMFESVLLNGETVDIDKYVQLLKRDLCEAMKLAQSRSGKQQRRQAEVYNKKSKGQPVDIGQRVLLANKGERGKKKLADRWESTVYIVIDKNPLLNTYKLRSPSGVVKTVHRNLIMPVDFLPLPDTDAVEEQL
ncbi:interleukin-1 receptor accessory protein-like 1-A isoform X1, partial [Silurus meridionalis]